jgi:energy-coupling factor transport system substrate-specific component
MAVSREFAETGSPRRYTTMDLVVMAVLGVVFGLINTPLGVFFQFLTASFGPIGQGFFAFWSISMVLTAFIVRKPGAAFINGLINGLFQLLSGNPAGLVNLAWGFALGLGTEIGLVIYLRDRYLSGSWSFTWVTALLCGAISNVLSFIVTMFAFNYFSNGPAIVVIGLVVQVIAGSIESGLVAYGLGTLLARSGLLKSFQAAAPSAARV